MSLYLIIQTPRCPSSSSPSGLVHQGCHSSHPISPSSPFVFILFSHRHILHKISKLTLENTASLSPTNHLHNCSSRWCAHQSFTLFSAAVILPSFPPCRPVGNILLNQNCCLILSAASSSCLQAVSDSCLHLVVITAA